MRKMNKLQINVNFKKINAGKYGKNTAKTKIIANKH